MKWCLEISGFRKECNSKTLSLLLAVLALVAELAQAQAPRDLLAQPNILMILADDLGWGDLGCQGNPRVKTPALDALARSGAQLERFYMSPESAPSRASILTGRHFLLNSVTANNGGAQHLHEGEITIAEVLKDRGYRTAYFGKWQNGANYPLTPLGQGFDHFIGYTHAGQSLEPGAMLWQDLDGIQVTEPVPDYITDQACNFLETSDAAPFFALVASPFPAASLNPDPTGNQPDPSFEDLDASLEQLDDQVGRLVRKLTELALLENTVVIFTSDCGPVEIEGRYRGRLYGSRGSLHEGGLRVPCLISWPGVINEELRVEEIAQHFDLLPTMAAIAGAQVPNDREMDGLNLAPLLLFGDVERWPNRNLNFAWIPGKDLDQARSGLRNSRWRAVKDPPWRRELWDGREEQWELYDMIADPYQDYDVSDIYPFVLAKLKSDYVQWFRHAITFGYPHIPTQIGHKEWPTVYLPADSAILSHSESSSIEREYLDGWADPKSSAQWPLHVVDQLEVEVSLEYQASSPTSIRVRVDEEWLESQLPSVEVWREVQLGTVNLVPRKIDVLLRTTGAEPGLKVRSVILRRGAPVKP